MVNLGTSTANVSVGYYQPSGLPWVTGSFYSTGLVAPANGGQIILRQYWDAAMPSGRGSAFIAADQKMASVVQYLANAPQVPSGGAYIGMSATYFVYYAPLLMRQVASTSNTVLVIQNGDPARPQNVTVNFSTAAGSPGNATYSKSLPNIPANSHYYYDLNDETLLPAGWYGSAEISGGLPIAVVVHIFSGPDTLQTYNALPAQLAASRWSIPLFASRLNNALSTPVTIQNISGTQISAGQIKLECHPHAGSGNQQDPLLVTNSSAIANRQTFIVNPVVDYTNLPTNWYGGCVVWTETGQNIAVVIQQRHPGANSNAAAYEGIRDVGSTEAMAPLIAKPSSSGGFATVLTVQNLGSATTTITITYRSDAGAIYTATLSNVAPGRSVIRSARTNCTPNCETQLPANFVGSAIISTNPPVPVGGYMQLTNTTATTGDTFLSHVLIER